MSKFPIALKLILRTDGLMSPLKGAKKIFYLIFEIGLSAPKEEINLCCKWDWNPGSFDPQSSALTNKPPALTVLIFELPEIY